MRLPGAAAAAFWALSCLVAGCGEDAICDASELSAALAAASAGDVVEIGACEITAELTVRAGVTLRGRGADASALIVPEGGRGLTLEAGGASPTTVEALRVESAGCAAIVAEGAGAVTLRDLTVDATRGVGIAAQNLTTLLAAAVEVRGPVDPDALPTSIPTPPYTCASSTLATHGIVVVGVADARMTDVRAHGFAAFGALFVDSTLTWAGGSVEDNVGTGLEVWGGEAELSDMRLCRARQGTLLVESFAGLFAADARVHSSALTVCESESYGLVHAGATAIHEDLSAIDNAFAGVWAQASPSLTLGGSATLLSGNGFAGVAAIDTATVSVSNTRVESTATRTSLSGGSGAIRAGDGIHINGAENVTVNGVTLRECDRVGLLLDLAGATPAALSVDAVEVDGAGTSLGAVAQNGTVPADWDRGITRLGATPANDAAFTGALDIAGAIGPSCLPDPSTLSAAGLDALLGR